MRNEHIDTYRVFKAFLFLTVFLPWTLVSALLAIIMSDSWKEMRNYMMDTIGLN